MQCVILAGGKGSRLKTLTQELPKSLIPIQTTPFLEHQLLLLKKNGVTDVLLCTGHLGHLIRDFAGDGSKWGLRINYSHEENPLGTGGALTLAYKRNLLRENFYLLYGDSYLPTRFSELAKKFLTSSSHAAMTVFKNEIQPEHNNVYRDSDHHYYYDKSRKLKNPSLYTFIDYGLLLFKRNVLDSFSLTKENTEYSDLSDFLSHLSAQKKLEFYEVQNRFYEIGSPEGIARLENRGLILLDRDGVINELVPESPLTLEQIQLLPGVEKSILDLNRAGYSVCICTNQPFAAKGVTSRDNLIAIHQAIVARLEINGAQISSSHICFHKNEDRCRCKKPMPGLLEDAFKENPCHLKTRSWMVGDRDVDINAGKAAGVKTAVAGNHPQGKNVDSDFKAQSLPEFVSWLLCQK